MNKKQNDKYKGKEYSTLQNIVYILKNAYDWQKGFMSVNALSNVTAVLMQLIVIAMPKFVIDTVIKETDPIELLKVILFISSMQFILMIINDRCNKQLNWRYTDIQMKYVEKRMEKSFTMDYENLEKPEILDNMEKAKRCSNNRYRGMLGLHANLNVFTKNTFTLIISSIAIIVLNPFIVIIMLVLSYGSYLALMRAKYVDKKKHWDVIQPKFRRIYYMNSMTQDFSYAKDIRLFHMKDWLYGKHKQINEEAHQLFAEHYIRWIYYAAFMQVFVFIQEIVLYIWLVYSVLNRGMGIGNFTLYIGIVRTFSINAVQFFDVLTSMKRGSMEINDYRNFVECPDNTNDLQEQRQESKQPELIFNLKEVNEFTFTFEHVSFQYPGQSDYILNDINITIQNGMKLAIVGLNGAGKTTFIKLFLRLYEPTKGRILLNGIDIKNYDRKEYYKLFAPVFQNVECFAFPIKENISMKVAENTHSSLVEKCIKKVGLEDKIKGFEKGMDTELLKILHKDGIDLSGGEKQKLALARAIYKEAQVIVLDEPTSALDPLAEYKLYKSFDKLIQNKTALYISHRLSSTRFCDAIAMFAKGNIIEYGTHEELQLKKEGAYAQLFEVQAHYYKDNEEEKEEAV